MFPKEPTRSYNSISLEKWFDYIQIDWEELFSDEVLSDARKLYLSGEVKGIELSEDAATIHYAFTRKSTAHRCAYDLLCGLPAYGGRRNRQYALLPTRKICISSNMRPLYVWRTRSFS